MELLIGLRLVRAGVLRRMSDGTPDFECEYKGHGFGVEVTTRACDDIAGALHQCPERKLEAGPRVRVTLMRQGDPVFHLSPEKVDEITDTIVASIATLSDTAPDGRILGNVLVEEAGLNAVLMPGEDTMPGMRVTFQPPLTGAEWDRHWKMAALLTRDRIQATGRKCYALPSIVVMDVSRLGEADRWPLGPWPGEFQTVVDGCDLGNLHGALVVRSTLDSMQFLVRGLTDPGGELHDEALACRPLPDGAACGWRDLRDMPIRNGQGPDEHDVVTVQRGQGGGHVQHVQASARRDVTGIGITAAARKVVELADDGFEHRQVPAGPGAFHSGRAWLPPPLVRSRDSLGVARGW